MTPRLVLASASPRRRALLEALGLHFEVVPSGVEEGIEGTPEEMVVTNARRKRDDVAQRIAPPDALVIAADTLVFVDNDVLGKPADAAEATSMLRRLSGRTHRVLTGLAVGDTASGQATEGCEATLVTFRDLTDVQIRVFVDVVNPVDRAGGYTVDGPGSLLVARYEGCYQNVLGLPLVQLDGLLGKMGHSLFSLVNPSKAQFL